VGRRLFVAEGWGRPGPPTGEAPRASSPPGVPGGGGQPNREASRRWAGRLATFTRARPGGLPESGGCAAGARFAAHVLGRSSRAARPNLRQRFEGPVPPSLGGLSKLEQLSPGANRLTGQMPPTTLTGMRKGPTERTNLFVQEVSGSETAVRVDFISTTGASSTRSRRPCRHMW
jgi:hypothetical protein